MVVKLLSIATIFFSWVYNNFATKIVGTHKVVPKLIKPFANNEECVNINGNKWLCDDHMLYLKDNDYIKDKKLISISPGGFNGFYMLGTTTFIKENYDLERFIFSGASAGAWNSLFMTYKHNPIEFVYNMLDDNLNNAISIIDLEYMMKYNILKKYKEDDFELKKLFIGVTSFEKLKIKTHIFSDFDTLEDVLNCCIASSHIPYITGTTFLNKYNNINAFDGGFSKYPYLNTIKPSLHITPEIWENNKQENDKKTPIEKYFTLKFHISDYTSLFSRSKYNFTDLFEKGYNDAKNNKHFLDNILL
jgi:hypothetical protein